MATLIEQTKLALRLSTDAFDDQIKMLLDAADSDLGVAGVLTDEDDSILRQAKITYVRMHFGQPDDYDRLKASYDEQKAQLSTCTGFTEWGGTDGSV